MVTWVRKVVPAMDKEIGDALSRQVIDELDSFYLYLQMAAWFDENHLSGFGAWLRRQAHEEVSHAQTIFNYLAGRGATVSLGQVAARHYTFSTVREVMDQILLRGKFVGSGISRLLDRAEAAGDDETTALLTWLAAVQLQEEAVMIDMLERVKALSSDGGDRLFELDKELALRKFEAAVSIGRPISSRIMVG